MNSSFEHFKATFNRRKQRTEKKKESYFNKAIDSNTINTEKIDIVEVSEDKLKHIKEQIRLDSKHRKNKQYIALAIIAITLFLLIYFIDR